MATSPPLSKFSTITFSFGAEMVYSQVDVRCGSNPQCSPTPDYQYATAALTLDSLETKQTLFYQIMLYDTRQTQNCSPNENPCLQGSYWFFPTNPYGVNFNAANFGAPCLGPMAGRVHYNLDVLPTLMHAITSGPSGLDANLSHWKISGMYIGTGLQGQAFSVFTVDSVSLVGQLK